MSDYQATPLVNIPPCQTDHGTRLVTSTGTLTINGETFWEVLNLERRMSHESPVGWLDPIATNYDASSWGVVELLTAFGFDDVYCHGEWVHVDDWDQFKYSSAAASIWLALAASVTPDTEALFVFEKGGDFWGEMISQNRYTRVTYELHAVKAVTL